MSSHPFPIALSYVNVSLDHHRDGTVSARRFFRGRGRDVVFMQASVDQMWRGGVRLVMLSHGINDLDLLSGALGVEYMMRCLETIVSEIEQSPRCVLVRTRRDLLQAEMQGKLAIVLHLTGCPINRSLQMLNIFARLGVRAMHPIIREEVYGGEWKSPLGLTPLGRAVIERMEALHMLVDTAHMGDATFRDTLRIARKPLIDSHTGCRGIVDSPRNRSDAQLRQLRRRGAVVGVHFASSLLADIVDQNRQKQVARLQRQVAQLRRRYREPYAFLEQRYNPARWSTTLGGSREDGIGPCRASLHDLLGSIDHLVQVAGPRNVCVGSDYALGSICAGVETADRLPNLVEALRQRGYGRRQLSNLLYGNLRRVLMSALPPQ